MAVEAWNSDFGQVEPPSSKRRGLPVFICRVVFASLQNNVSITSDITRSWMPPYPIEKSPRSRLMNPPTFSGCGTWMFHDSWDTLLQTFKTNLCPPEDV